MATLKHTQSRRMYSWWWDSHISPKNSKWLQDNLTDMDFKLKAMIKLIEEDADSFARRAEMYYKKRPELMKLIEEFYRAYRALAERYDHATVVIRQAHRTMTEAFPNQVPPLHGDDSPANSLPEDDPRTPEISTHTRSLFQADDDQKDVTEHSSPHSYDAKKNGEHTGDSDFAARRKGFNEINRRVRKGLNFQDMGERESFQETEEILVLRKALAEVEAEKEAGLVQYQQSLDKLSKLESEISRAQEDSRELSAQASISQAEAENLKETITKLESEKDANLLQYHQCLDKISSLEDIISQAESLKEELTKLTSEKETALDQYVLSLEKISNLENRLELAEEDARKSNERAEKAEREIEMLTQEISKLSKEKEAAALRNQQCLDTISSLESKLLTAQEEAERLRMEIDNGVSKLKGVEEERLMLERSNQSLHAELESLMVKAGAQGEELTEKQKELGRLWTCVQEERLRFVEAETAFQTLQHLHAQAQEQLHGLASELQNRVQILNDIESHNRELVDEVSKIREENTGLNELNVSSAMSIKNMQEEITILREAKGKLEEEVELRVDQRNALQQEIYCLKEELNDLNKNHLSTLEQVTELQDKNSNLKEISERERSEKIALLQKLEILAELLEKNTLLENSLSDLSAELESARGKIISLEESCRSLLGEKLALLDEKTSLGSQLQVANENLEKLSEKNSLLVNSLSDTHGELQTLKVKSKSLEDSCQSLADQKAGLAIEKDNLSSQLEIAQLRIEELEKGLAEFQERYLLLEKDKASAHIKIEELQISLDEEKQERASFAEMNETRFASMQSKMHLLQEELGIELDRALQSELEIFILQRSSRDLKEANTSLLTKSEKLLELSTLSDKLISQLQDENIEQQNEVKSLSHQITILRKGFFPLLKALDLVLDGPCKDTIEQDLLNLTSALHKIEKSKRSFNKTEEENQQLCIEKMVLVTLLQKLRSEAEGLEAERSVIEKELRSEIVKLQSINEALKVKLTEGDRREEALKSEVGNLQRNLLVVQQAMQDAHAENLKIFEERGSLTEEVVLLNESNCTLEEENYVICGEMLSNVYLSLIFKNYIDDKTLKMGELGEHLDTIQEELYATKRKLEEVQTENHGLKETLQKSEDELKIITGNRDKLSQEIVLTNNLFHEEREKSKIREENLRSELQKQMNEIEILERDAAVLYGHFQTSNVYRVLYEQKVHELGEAFDSLRDSTTVKDTENKLLKEKINLLTAESKGLNAQMATYGRAMNFLGECISSLENRISLRGKVQKVKNEEFEVSEVAKDLDDFLDDKSFMVSDAFLEFQILRKKVRAIEKTVVEMEMENSDVHSKLEAALQQIEELKSEGGLRKKKSTSEVSGSENTLLTKDIMLDQISECSPFAISTRQQVEMDNQNFELNESANEGHKQNGEYHASDALSEKELGVDKLAIPRNSTDHIQEGNNRKVLHRLNSDVQKLMNLHITVQDLKKRIEITEKSRKGKAVDECDTLKAQIEEAESTILKLFDLNGKLMKTIENESTMPSENFGSARRRETSVQARKISEKIGRLQLEVQQIQFVLLKLDGQKESKGKIPIAETKKRVLLRDYLYGLRTNHSKRKKTPFCGCFQPSTNGE